MAEFDEKLNSLLSNPDAMAQIMQLAQSFSGSGVFQQPSDSTFSRPTQKPAASSPPPPPSPSAQPNPGDFFSSFTGGMDPSMLVKLLPIIRELGGQQDSHARQLLYALRPYLKNERQEKIERALQLAKLFHVGKLFLSKWEG